MSNIKFNVNVFGEAVGKMAEATSEIAKALTKWFGSSDHRRMTKGIRHGDKIVKRIKELDLNDKELNKLMEKWDDKYNN